MDTPASIAAHKRSITCVRLKVGLLDALLRANHGTSIFVPLRGVDEKHDIEISAGLAFLHDWLSGLLTGICVEIGRYRADSALQPNRSNPAGSARLPTICLYHDPFLRSIETSKIVLAICPTSADFHPRLVKLPAPRSQNLVVRLMSRTIEE